MHDLHHRPLVVGSLVSFPPRSFAVNSADFQSRLTLAEDENEQNYVSWTGHCLFEICVHNFTLPKTPAASINLKVDDASRTMKGQLYASMLKVQEGSHEVALSLFFSSLLYSSNLKVKRERDDGGEWREDKTSKTLNYRTLGSESVTNNKQQQCGF